MRKMAFPTVVEEEGTWTRLPKLEAEWSGAATWLGSVDSNFTAGWRRAHTAPRVLPACVRCLIALNCAAVFSPQTSVRVTAPSTDQAGVGNGRG